MKRSVLWAGIAVAVLAVLGGCRPKTSEEGPAGVATGTQASVRTVSIRVPCGLTVPIREAIARFETAHPDIKVKGTYDNAITNALNIKEKGDRPDLFISPGERETQILEEAGLIDSGTKTAIAQFELVVVTPKDNPMGIHSLEDITKADVITMPDPERNSIGMYGKQALQKAGLWEAVDSAGKVVLTEFPIAAYEKVAAGKSDAALMFRNCPLQTDPEKLDAGSVAIVADVDKALYDEPLCYISVLKGAANPEDAKAFIAFLLEPDTQALMAENGMQTLGDRVEVVAFYPDTEGHADLKKLILDLPARYPGQVQAEFVDFTSDEGYPRFREAGLSCGGILINGEQTFTCERADGSKEVTLMMNEGGEWTRDDLYQIIDQVLAGGSKADAEKPQEATAANE